MAGYAEFGDLDVKAQEEQHWRKHAHWRKRAQQKFTEKKEDGDCRIPSKFPERPIAVRSAEVAREISHRSFGDREFIVQRTMSMKTPKSRDAKSRYNQDRQIKDEIWTVHLYGHVAARKPYRKFRVRDFIMQRTMTKKTPKSRYAISRFDRNR